MGDSGRNETNNKKINDGIAETIINISKDNVAAQANETATKQFMATVFMIAKLPLNRIKDISHKYIFVVGKAIPMPPPDRNLPSNKYKYEGAKYVVIHPEAYKA